jgi:RNA polymerase sigma-70 factor (ECF subfamily)
MMWDRERGDAVVDEAEFDVLYEREWTSLVGQVMLVCGDPQEAADCVQEAFARAWQHRARLEADAGGWVRTAALRVAVSRWRKARNAILAWGRDEHRTVHRHHGDHGDDLDTFDSELWQALRALPSAQREAVVLHHLLDLGVGQVAELVGAPSGTVKARLARGRAALAARLADPAPGASGSPRSTAGPAPAPDQVPGGAR